MKVIDFYIFGDANSMKKAVSKKSTIYDIAARVGTSAATVSRVLSKSGYPVSEDLHRRITDAAAELNYSPNIVGRMLKKSQSTDVGIIIPTISNPYYSTLILGAEQEARKEGYNLFLCNSLRDPLMERKYLESLYQKQVRGIMISAINENHALVKELQKYGVKIVAFDQDAGDLKCSKVGFDYTKGAVMAMEYLMANGHKNIALLSAPVTRKSRSDVLSGYRRALSDHGLQPREESIVLSQTEEELPNGTYEFQNGKKLATMFMQLFPRPTAILAINDLTACGIMQELIENGVQVPRDVSVIGFDNIELSAMVNPPLTTISQPSFETGRLACRMLLDGLSDEGAEDVSVVLQPQLVIRDSVMSISV
jgi:LacI family transcriptional regulator